MTAPCDNLDANELPEEGAVRECKEETGLDIEIVGDAGPDLYEGFAGWGMMMKRPAAMFLENIPAYPGSTTKPAEPAHQHMDFVFVGRMKDPSQPIVPESPDDDVRWFTMDEVRALPTNEIHENTRAFILTAH